MPLVLLVAGIWAGAQPAPGVAPIRFRNVASEAGIDFVLENSATPEKQIIETMPGGVVAFDYDGDGLTDIFFTNGAAVPSLEKNHVKFRNRLFRNLGGMRFKDVTEEAGFKGTMTLVGCAMLWVVVALVIASRWVPVAGWLIIPLLVAFLAMQILGWAIPRRRV